MALALALGDRLPARRLAPLLVAVLLVFLPSVARPIGMIAELDQTGRTTERFQPIPREIGLSSLSEIPLLNPPRIGPQIETEINYRTGYVQLRSYYQKRRISDPLALEIKAFNAYRNDGQVVNAWRKNLRLSLKKEQFQKKGSGIGWTFGNVPKSVRAILGEGGIGLNVNGYRKITFSGTSRWQGKVQNTGSYRQNKFPSLDMKQASRFTIKGNIGSKIHVTVDQDSKRESELANRIQIRYKGDEDDILQSVELGNTTLNLPNTKFVGYSQRIQGLFGVKATAKLANLDLTMITSQEKGNTEKTRFTAGSAENISNLRDYQYLQGAYFDIGFFGRLDDPNRWRFVAGDSIIDIKLFERGTETNSDDPYAKLSIDPTPTGEGKFDEVVSSSYVRELNQNEDYFYEPNQFWIRLETPLRVNELLACWMTVKTDTGIVEIGSLVSDNPAATRDTISLKLLKPARRNSGDATWDYEWKNVYYLGAKNLSLTDFELDIYKGAAGTEDDGSNLNNQGGTPYLQIFGLDVANDNGERNKPDGRIDNADYLLDLRYGHLLFPNQRPFDPFEVEDTAFVQATHPAGGLNPRVPNIYLSSNVTDLRNSSEYYFRIATFSKRTATYSLKRVNILEESEMVTLDQQKLTRGIDYNIDYELGQIVFLNERALDPNADLTVDFEYAPFISAEKKTLFGMRAEYESGPNFKVGSSFLYKGQKSTDRKPKLGQEQSKSMIGELDFAYSTTPQWMTTLADAVPLIETSAKSTLRISSEIAYSMPNPNSEGQVILDDFEGVELSTELGRLREFWTKSSPPDPTVWPGRTIDTRAGFIWYNPYLDEFLVTEVYDRQFDPNRSIPRHKVLVLRMMPDSVDPANSWGGIMRGLSSGMHDQSKARVLEVRLGTYGDVTGKLHIDLGEISEDIDGDGVLDDENRALNGYKNDVLDPDEDTGLDGLFSVGEPGYDPITNPDPSGDDWAYEDSDPYNYDHINGTEGNAKGDLYGIRPDSEDIGGDIGLDQINDYYSFTIDLINSPYLVDSSQYDAANEPRSLHSGLIFRTYRIPLWEQTDNEANAGNGDSTLIRYARLWVDGFTEQAEVYVAAMEIVENRWEVEDTLTDGKSFRAEVINNEENQNYESPPGIAGYYDRQADLREREQSLLLKFENFEPDDTGWAIKQLNRAEDYTGYRKLQMWVHGSEELAADTAIVSFIFRFGKSEEAFYEYHVDLEPGWAEQNKVSCDFDDLTPLKETAPLCDTASLVPEYCSEHYKIRGSPSLTQVKYLAVGVTYKEGRPDFLSGDVWVDELVLKDVRDDRGTAGRLSLSADFADLLGFSVNSEYKTYSFRGLTAGTSRKGANLLNGSTRTRHDANTRISLNKFLPASWRVSLPVTFKYSWDESKPKLLTGSDIVLTPGDSLYNSQITKKIGYRVSASAKMQLPTKHWLAKFTINALGFSASFNRDTTQSPRTISNRESYTANAKYNLSLSNLLPISPLIWTKYLFFPKKIWDTRLSLLPKSFRADGSISRERSRSINSQNYRISSYSRRFRGKADWTLEPFKSLSGTYGFSTERDLQDRPELVHLSLNPRDFKFGQETKFRQQLGARYTPPLLTFLSPRMTYNATYNEDSDPKRYRDNTRKVAVNLSVGADAALDLRKLLGSKRSRRSPSRAKARQPAVTSKDEEAPPDSADGTEAPPKKDDSGGFSFRPQAPFVWLLRTLTGPLAPINANYKHSENRSALGLKGRPPLQYRLGLTSEHEQEKDLGTISSRDRDSEKLSDNYGLRSKVAFFGLADIAISYDYRKSSVSTITKTRQTSRVFPKMSTSIKKLDKIFLLKRIAPIRWMLKMTSASLNFNRTYNALEKWRDPGGDTTGYWTRENEGTTDDLGASLKLTQNFKNGWRLSADYGWKLSHRIDEKYFPTSYLETQKFIQTISFSTNYSFRAPNGVRFPLLRKLRLKSTLSLNLQVKLDSDRSESRNTDSGDYIPKQDRSRINVKIRANYSFSSSMKGGFDMNWMDSKDKLSAGKPTNHSRQVNIWLEFRF